jgi:segregation and condensation protein B
MSRSTARRAKKDEPLGIDSFRQPREEEGLSLESIGQAFAEMLTTGEDPYTSPTDTDADPLLDVANEAGVQSAPEQSSAAADGSCEISPRSILEAMLFVGAPDNQPLSAELIAGMMRGVRPAEIDDLVADLNRQYRDEARPYSVVSVGAGYRLALRDDFAFVREKLYGRPRAARLSPAAVEVLAIVAYNEPVTAEQVARMRGTASGPILSQLVRRALLRIERALERPHTGVCVHQRQNSSQVPALPCQHAPSQPSSNAAQGRRDGPGRGQSDRHWARGLCGQS